MTGSTKAPASAGTAVIVFEPPKLQRLVEAAQQLGFVAQAFDNAEEALAYVQHPETPVDVVIACGTMSGVLNGSDLATQLSAAYPTLPLVVTDHFDGLVADNVMCLDTPWTVEDIEDKVHLMVTRLSKGKGPATASEE